MSRYAITADAGSTHVIRAESRAEAIRIYRALTGAPEDYIKNHCVIRRKS